MCAKVQAGLQTVQYGPDRQGQDRCVDVLDNGKVVTNPRTSSLYTRFELALTH